MQNNVVLWGQFQNSNVGSRTKATLAVLAMAVQSSHICHGVHTYPKDLSLLFISWWVLSEAEEARWHYVFADYPGRNAHMGLMGIWRWERLEEHWAAQELDTLCCALWAFRGSTLGLFMTIFCFTCLCLSLIPALWLEEVTHLGVAPSASVQCWQLVQLWADVTPSCSSSQTNADVLPKHGRSSGCGFAVLLL